MCGNIPSQQCRFYVLLTFFSFDLSVRGSSYRLRLQGLIKPISFLLSSRTFLHFDLPQLTLFTQSSSPQPGDVHNSNFTL